MPSLGIAPRHGSCAGHLRRPAHRAALVSSVFPTDGSLASPGDWDSAGDDVAAVFADGVDGAADVDAVLGDGLAGESAGDFLLGFGGSEIALADVTSPSTDDLHVYSVGVVGDQVLTGGLLAWRLGVPFYYWHSPSRVSWWPRAQRAAGTLLEWAIFIDC